MWNSSVAEDHEYLLHRFAIWSFIGTCWCCYCCYRANGGIRCRLPVFRGVKFNTFARNNKLFVCLASLAMRASEWTLNRLPSGRIWQSSRKTREFSVSEWLREGGRRARRRWKSRGTELSSNLYAAKKYLPNSDHVSGEIRIISIATPTTRSLAFQCSE